MSEDTPQERRSREDRRNKNLSFWHPRRLHGRRTRNRRAEEDDRPYLVDRFSWPVSVMAVLLLLLSLVDGLITVSMLDQGFEEANPLMRVLLERGTGTFFVGKYILTAAFLPVALVLYRYPMFGTRLRVGHFIPIVVALYVVLIAYQYTLWAKLNGANDPHPGNEAATEARVMGVRTVASVRRFRP